MKDKSTSKLTYAYIMLCTCACIIIIYEYAVYHHVGLVSFNPFSLALSLSLSLSPSLTLSLTYFLTLFPSPLHATARSYQPLNFLLTQNAVIGVGGVLCGALLITILVLAIGLLVYLIQQHRVKMGKHETLLEEEEYEKRQRRRDKRRKV